MDKRSVFFVICLTAVLFFINQWFSSSPPQKPATALVESGKKEMAMPIEDTSPTPAFPPSNKEQFYVIENEYQQLVFSNMGGALSEINLPLYSKENPTSSVRPIAFDRNIAENFPYNDHFPAYKYSINDGNKIVKQEAGNVGGYYPLLRRSVFSKKGNLNFQTPARFYALNIVSDDPSLEHQIYTVKRLEKNLIEFQLDQPQRKITKTYYFPQNVKDAPYTLEVAIKVDGDARGLMLTSGVPEVELISGSAAPALKYRVIRSNNKSQVEQISLPKEKTSFSSVSPDWICNSNGYFGMIVDPLTEIGAGFKANMVPGTEDITRLTLIDPEYNLYPAEKYPGYEMLLPLRAQAMQFRFYAGPFEESILKKVDQNYSNAATGYNPSYIGALNFHGWFTFISEPFAKFLFILLKFFHQITTSWGISIILLTVALRLMLYPLNAWSIRSSLRMQQIAPKVTQIQEKYKKDPKKAQTEVMNLYREQGVNPLTGCFPLLIQLPFLIGMFDLLKSTFVLRGVPFIPGWIDNLTAPDVLFSWNFPIIFFGTDFHLLPFLLGGVMWAQQRFSANMPKDPKLMTDQQKQQRMMGNLMTIVFTVMFYHFPSGLNLYWLSSMALGILQQWWMSTRMSKKVVA